MKKIYKIIIGLICCVIGAFSISKNSENELTSNTSTEVDNNTNISQNSNENENQEILDKKDDMSEVEKIDTVDDNSYGKDDIVTDTLDKNSNTEEKNKSEISEYRFRNKKLLNQHFEKHGIEMGFETAEEYESAAAKVIVNSKVLHKTEKEDGDDVYYLESTNEFVVVSTDGYIRTYFYPNSGIAYFNRQ